MFEYPDDNEFVSPDEIESSNMPNLLADDLLANDLFADDLLAKDRQVVREAAERQIAGGMYRRIAEAHRIEMDKDKAQFRWLVLAFGAVVTVVLLMGLWIGGSLKPPFLEPVATGSSDREVKPQATLQPANPAIPNSGTRAAAASPLKKDAPLRSVRLHSLQSAKVKPSSAPRLATFPSNVAPTEQERFLLQAAISDPEELVAIAKLDEQHKKEMEEQREAFEKWIRDGQGQGPGQGEAK